MKGFKRKLSSGTSAVQKGDLSNFPSLLNLVGDKDLGKLKDRICDNLSRLQDFPSVSTINLDLVVSPFDFVDSAEEIDFSACERR
ncbi:hypothetical protein ANN_22691 [Periplaneta americana]|uniref:Uncharacterized protein n=1 Tax=Periplaneta americana TaxID=6978 RepID=A0ABQ8S9G8_PERAM|nr:hypothetical protein ANN_22691 [Periplaneta americana]